KHLASGSLDHEIRIWDAATAKPLLRLGRHLYKRDLPGAVGQQGALRSISTYVGSGHGGGITGLAFSSDGRRIATASHDKTARIWDCASGNELSRNRLNAYVTTMLQNQPFAAAGCSSYF